VAVDNDCNGDVVFGDLVHRRIMRRVHVGDSSTDMPLSPTARSLIVATGRDLVSVDVQSGRVRHLFTAPFPIVWTASGPSGRFLAIGDTDTVGIVDLWARLSEQREVEGAAWLDADERPSDWRADSASP
jgi:hypothetical protein